MHKKFISLVRTVCAKLANGPTRGLVQKGCRWLLSKPRRILSGPGRGLWFDPRGGGYPGQILGTTDYNEQAAFASTLKKGDVFYDVGANVGFYAIIGARLVGARGKVFAFEPHHLALATLRHNIKLNQFGWIEPVPVIVSSRSRMMGLQMAPESQQSGVSESNALGGDEVVAVSLDEWFESGYEASPPNVVMIDVEGHEYEVLTGMTRLIKKFMPQLLVEVHPGAEAKVREFFRKELEPLGYHPNRLDGKRLNESDGRFHVVFARTL